MPDTQHRSTWLLAHVLHVRQDYLRNQHSAVHVARTSSYSAVVCSHCLAIYAASNCNSNAQYYFIQSAYFVTCMAHLTCLTIIPDRVRNMKYECHEGRDGAILFHLFMLAGCVLVHLFSFAVKHVL